MTESSAGKLGFGREILGGLILPLVTGLPSGETVGLACGVSLCVGEPWFPGGSCIPSRADRLRPERLFRSVFPGSLTLLAERSIMSKDSAVRVSLVA